MAAYGSVSAVRLLHEGMRVAGLNQKLIANNIANADTPHFNPSELDFQATLRKSLEGRAQISLRKTDARHLESSYARPAMERLATLSKNDYNKVDLDKEMVSLGDNTSRYTTYGSLLVKQFQQVKRLLSDLR